MPRRNAASPAFQSSMGTNRSLDRCNARSEVKSLLVHTFREIGSGDALRQPPDVGKRHGSTVDQRLQHGHCLIGLIRLDRLIDLGRCGTCCFATQRRIGQVHIFIAAAALMRYAGGRRNVRHDRDQNGMMMTAHLLGGALHGKAIDAIGNRQVAIFLEPFDEFAQRSPLAVRREKAFSPRIALQRGIADFAHQRGGLVEMPSTFGSKDFPVPVRISRRKHLHRLRHCWMAGRSHPAHIRARRRKEPQSKRQWQHASSVISNFRCSTSPSLRRSYAQANAAK